MSFYRLSASCTHVSGLLHALVGLCPDSFQHPGGTSDMGELEEVLPITSYACQWKPPCKRKESTLQMSEVQFQKHVYGREKKKSSKPLEDFDPRPPEYHNTARGQMKELLEKICGKGLCVSLMLDPKSQYWQSNSALEKPLPPVLPSKEELQQRVAMFKESLRLPSHKIRELEQNTRSQCRSSLWYSARRYRITASFFGEIRRRLPTTPPHSLVSRIIESKQFVSPATEWGKSHEDLAIELYIQQKHADGNTNLYCCKSGFVVSEDYPFLGASPDGSVYDPSSPDQFGSLEVKCPYSCRNITPKEACMKSDFCSKLVTTNGNEHPKLRTNHPYYSQVQGQMAITGRKWCDFVLFTEKGLSVERIPFDENFWRSELLPKLIDFYDNCLGPEIVSPIRVLGMPVRDLR